MYLRGFPKYFIKDGERRAIYYSVDARDLLATGWVEEDKIKAEKREAPEVKSTAKPEIKEKLEVDIVIDEQKQESPDFEAMTRQELLKYALDRGVDLPNNASKAQLVESCKEIK